MGIFARIKREVFIRPWLRQGYSRRLANSYYKKVCNDLKTDNGVSAADKKWAHEHKYFSDSIAKYDLKNAPDKYITDLDYMYLKPFNNSFTKWVRDLVTANKVLIDYREYLPRLYFNIIEREDKKVFLPIDTIERADGENYDDFIKLLDEKGELIIRPDRFSAYRSAYRIVRTGDNSYKLCEDEICRVRMGMHGDDYDRDYLLSEDYPEDLPEEADAAGVRWLAFGVRGRGLQGKRFDYYLLSDGLRIAVTLPWARIYGDPDEERAALESAFHLVRLCLAREFDGRRLEVSLNRVRCSWRLRSDGETIVEGEGVDGLLDELGTEDADVPMRYWISV